MEELYMNFFKFFGVALACSFFASTVAGAMNMIRSDVIPNGNYYLLTKLDQGKAMDVEGASIDNRANVQLYRKNNTPAQVWNVNRLPNGNYTLRNLNSGKMLDVEGGEASNGTNIHQYEQNSTAAQQWRIKHVGGINYKIYSDINGKMLVDVKYGQTTDGTNIQLWTDNGTDAQLWNFQRA